MFGYSMKSLTVAEFLPVPGGFSPAAHVCLSLLPNRRSISLRFADL